jgi:hypothetical protein
MPLLFSFFRPQKRNATEMMADAGGQQHNESADNNFYATKQQEIENKQNKKTNQWLLRDQIRMFEQYAPSMNMQQPLTTTSAAATTTARKRALIHRNDFLNNLTIKVDMSSPRFPVGNHPSSPRKKMIKRYGIKKPVSSSNNNATMENNVTTTPRTQVHKSGVLPDINKTFEQTLNQVTSTNNGIPVMGRENLIQPYHSYIVQSPSGKAVIESIDEYQNKFVIPHDSQAILSPFKSTTKESHNLLAVKVPSLPLDSLAECESDFLGNSARSIKSPRTPTGSKKYSSETMTARAENIVTKRPKSAPRVTNHSYHNSMRRYKSNLIRGPMSPTITRSLSQISFDFDKSRRQTPNSASSRRNSAPVDTDYEDGPPGPPDHDNQYDFVENSNTVRHVAESTRFMSELMGMDFAVDIPVNSKYIEAPSFEQHIQMLNDKVHELTIIFKEKLRQQFMTHKREIDAMEREHHEQMQMACSIYDTKVDEMIARYQEYRADKLIFSVSY